MMCLANDVETVQGDPATSYEMSHDKRLLAMVIDSIVLIQKMKTMWLLNTITVPQQFIVNTLQTTVNSYNAPITSLSNL